MDGFSMVVALEDCDDNVALICARLEPAVERGAELIVVGHHKPQQLEDSGLTHVWLKADPDARIPHMWRDGFAAARGEWVVTFSGHCVPHASWAETAAALAPGADAAAIGGAICLPPQSTALNEAIYMLRYARYEGASGDVGDVAADHAFYRRQSVLEQPDLLADGFWEPEFHARFRRAGLKLYYAPELCVDLVTQYSYRGFAAQRREHAVQFGYQRGQLAPAARKILLACASPVLPLLLFAKTVIAANRTNRSYSAASYLYLLAFTLAWSRGEIRGHLSAVKEWILK